MANLTYIDLFNNKKMITGIRSCVKNVDIDTISSDCVHGLQRQQTPQSAVTGYD